MAGKPGRRPRKSIDDQILETINDITKYEEAVITLKNKLDDLYKQKREEDMYQLYTLIQDKGITIEEAESILETYGSKEREVVCS